MENQNNSSQETKHYTGYSFGFTAYYKMLRTFSLSGRATCSEFWVAHITYGLSWVFLLLVLICYLNVTRVPYGYNFETFGDEMIYTAWWTIGFFPEDDGENLRLFPLIHGIYCLATAWQMFALQVRRLHDTGKSGWRLLYGLIVPIVGPVSIFIFNCMDSDYGRNKFGESEKYPNK